MGRRHWQGKRRVRDTGPEGDRCWYCMASATKKKLLRDRQNRKERLRARQWREPLPPRPKPESRPNPSGDWP